MRVGALLRKFSPDQPRDEDGKWSSGFSPNDKLKLNGLGPFILTGAKIVASDKARTGNFSAVMAMTTVNGKPELRLGIVSPDDEGKWTGGNHGGTVRLNEAGIAQLKDGLAGLAKSHDTWNRRKQSLVDEIDEFDGFADDADLDEEEQALVDEFWEIGGGGVVDSGMLASGTWGELRYEIIGTDGDEPLRTRIGVVGDVAPPNAGDFDSFGVDYTMEFHGGKDILKFLKKIEDVTSVDPEARLSGPGRVRKFDPGQPRDENGKWSKTGAIKKALEVFAGPKDDQGVTSAAYFDDRDGAETGRFWEIEHDGNDTFSIVMNHDDSEYVETDEDGNELPVGINLELNTQEMYQLGDEIALTLLKRDPPAFDPGDRKSALLASMLSLSRGGVYFQDGRNFDFSTDIFEATNSDGETEMFALSNAELNQLHSTVMSAIFKAEEASRG